MNDEIKEILSYLKKKENTRRIKCITIEESKRLLDYITNLQHTKEYLGEVLHEQDLELEDYKSRIEKAVEYINERKTLNWYADGVFVYELLNILNGRSDE